MRRYWILTLVLALVLPLFAVGQAGAADGWLDTARLDRGVITIRHDADAAPGRKLLVTKGTDKYTYNLTAGAGEETFPLQMGNGEYHIAVLERTTGIKYRIVHDAIVHLELADDAVVYLNAIQNVDWNETSEAVRIAKELTKTLTENEEKIQAIHRYITETIHYDNELAANVPADYLPEIDRTLANGTDICYGYAALFGAMARALDIPAKLVMGTSTDVAVYHAWNEVLLNGNWVVVDTTLDAGRGDTAGFAKDAARYTVARVY